MEKMREEVVSIVHQTPRVLLAMKKNKFGSGKYNGFGGGVENGESLEVCAVRETYEEGNIRILDPVQLGRILFRFQTDEQDHLVHFFKSESYLGRPSETEEMIPEWFDEKNIPYDQMLPADKYWLPMFLEGRRFSGNVLFNEGFKLCEYEIEEIDSLEEVV